MIFDEFSPSRTRRTLTAGGRTLRALGLDGKPFEMDADGMLAVCIQHEMDHLEGKLFVDYLSELKRQLIRRRLEKERKQRPTGSDARSKAQGVARPRGASTPAL